MMQLRKIKAETEEVEARTQAARATAGLGQATTGGVGAPVISGAGQGGAVVPPIGPVTATAGQGPSYDRQHIVLQNLPKEKTREVIHQAIHERVEPVLAKIRLEEDGVPPQPGEKIEPMESFIRGIHSVLERCITLEARTAMGPDASRLKVQNEEGIIETIIFNNTVDLAGFDGPGTKIEDLYAPITPATTGRGRAEAIRRDDEGSTEVSTADALALLRYYNRSGQEDQARKLHRRVRESIEKRLSNELFTYLTTETGKQQIPDIMKDLTRGGTYLDFGTTVEAGAIVNEASFLAHIEYMHREPPLHEKRRWYQDSEWTEKFLEARKEAKDDVASRPDLGDWGQKIAKGALEGLERWALAYDMDPKELRSNIVDRIIRQTEADLTLDFREHKTGRPKFEDETESQRTAARKLRNRLGNVELYDNRDERLLPAERLVNDSIPQRYGDVQVDGLESPIQAVENHLWNIMKGETVRGYTFKVGSVRGAEEIRELTEKQRRNILDTTGKGGLEDVAQTDLTPKVVAGSGLGTDTELWKYVQDQQMTDRILKKVNEGRPEQQRIRHADQISQADITADVITESRLTGDVLSARLAKTRAQHDFTERGLYIPFVTMYQMSGVANRVDQELRVRRIFENPERVDPWSHEMLRYEIERLSCAPDDQIMWEGRRLGDPKGDGQLAERVRRLARALVGTGDPKDRNIDLAIFAEKALTSTQWQTISSIDLTDPNVVKDKVGAYEDFFKVNDRNNQITMDLLKALSATGEEVKRLDTIAMMEALKNIEANFMVRHVKLTETAILRQTVDKYINNDEVRGEGPRQEMTYYKDNVTKWLKDSLSDIYPEHMEMQQMGILLTRLYNRYGQELDNIRDALGNPYAPIGDSLVYAGANIPYMGGNTTVAQKRAEVLERLKNDVFGTQDEFGRIGRAIRREKGRDPDEKEKMDITTNLYIYLHEYGSRRDVFGEYCYRTMDYGSPQRPLYDIQAEKFISGLADPIRDKHGNVYFGVEVRKADKDDIDEKAVSRLYRKKYLNTMLVRGIEVEKGWPDQELALELFASDPNVRPFWVNLAANQGACRDFKAESDKKKDVTVEETHRILLNNQVNLEDHTAVTGNLAAYAWAYDQARRGKTGTVGDALDTLTGKIKSTSGKEATYHEVQGILAACSLPTAHPAYAAVAAEISAGRAGDRADVPAIKTLLGAAAADSNAMVTALGGLNVDKDRMSKELANVRENALVSTMRFYGIPTSADNRKNTEAFIVTYSDGILAQYSGRARDKLGKTGWDRANEHFGQALKYAQALPYEQVGKPGERIGNVDRNKDLRVIALNARGWVKVRRTEDAEARKDPTVDPRVTLGSALNDFTAARMVSRGEEIGDTLTENKPLFALTASLNPLKWFPRLNHWLRTRFPRTKEKDPTRESKEAEAGLAYTNAMLDRYNPISGEKARPYWLGTGAIGTAVGLVGAGTAAALGAPFVAGGLAAVGAAGAITLGIVRLAERRHLAKAWGETANDHTEYNPPFEDNLGTGIDAYLGHPGRTYEYKPKYFGLESKLMMLEGTITDGRLVGGILKNDGKTTSLTPISGRLVDKDGKILSGVLAGARLSDGRLVDKNSSPITTAALTDVYLTDKVVEDQNTGKILEEGYINDEDAWRKASLMFKTAVGKGQARLHAANRSWWSFLRGSCWTYEWGPYMRDYVQAAHAVDPITVKNTMLATQAEEHLIRSWEGDLWRARDDVKRKALTHYKGYTVGWGGMTRRLLVQEPWYYSPYITDTSIDTQITNIEAKNTANQPLTDEEKAIWETVGRWEESNIDHHTAAQVVDSVDRANRDWQVAPNWWSGVLDVTTGGFLRFVPGWLTRYVPGLRWTGDLRGLASNEVLKATRKKAMEDTFDANRNLESQLGASTRTRAFAVHEKSEGVDGQHTKEDAAEYMRRRMNTFQTEISPLLEWVLTKQLEQTVYEKSGLKHSVYLE